MCKQCEIKPVYEFTNKRKLCARCFVRWFEKKFLYTNRKFRLIKKDDAIFYRRGKDFRDVVLESIFKKFKDKFMIELTFDLKKANKIAISSTTDSESFGILNEIIYGRAENLKNFFPVNGKIIKPLYLFLDKEVLLYAKIKKLKFKQSKEKKDKISKFLSELEKKHPEVKQAIVSGMLRYMMKSNKD